MSYNDRQQFQPVVKITRTKPTNICIICVFLHTDQEGTEEDEGDKVEVGEVTSTLLPHSS